MAAERLAALLVLLGADSDGLGQAVLDRDKGEGGSEHKPPSLGHGVLQMEEASC